MAVLLPFVAFAEDTPSQLPQLIISEVKVKNDTSPGGYNEFIELYNAAETSLNLNQFVIEYYNSPAPSADATPIKKVVIADNLMLAGQFLVFAANADQIPSALDSPFSSLSDSGGLIRVASTDGTLQDQVAWTSTSSLAIAPVLYLSSSTSNKTQSFTRQSDSQGSLVLANSDWKLLTPSPHADELSAVPIPEPDPELMPSEQVEEQPTEATDPSPLPTTPEPPMQTETESQTSEKLNISRLEISELMPNPASPANDSTDEYVELYNPNNEAVDLSGYKLQTGNSYSYSYTFSDGTLQPYEYRAFYVSETDVLLANSGGRARILGPDGQIIYEASAYGEAKEGMAWANFGTASAGDWKWTTSLTPNTTNVLTLPLVKVAPVKTSATKALPKPKAAAKPKAASTKKTTSSNAKAKAPKSATVAAAVDGDQPETSVSSIHPGIVAAAGALVLGYGLWEYRLDFRNRLYQFRRYRATRRASRLQA